MVNEAVKREKQEAALARAIQEHYPFKGQRRFGLNAFKRGWNDAITMNPCPYPDHRTDNGRNMVTWSRAYRRQWQYGYEAFQKWNSGEIWHVAGVTISVNQGKNTLRLWLDSPQGEYDTPITDDMPHWLLQEGVSFKTTIPRACVRSGDLEGVVWGEFSVLPYSSMTADECVEEIGSMVV